MSRRSFPSASSVKQLPLALLVALIFSGCGSRGNTNWQEVHGDGFRFEAPSAWLVSGSTAAHGRVELVQVQTFRLLHRYEPSRRAGAARELDGVAAGLAKQQRGTVTHGRWLEAGGLAARSYRIDYGGKVKKVEAITFVLSGRREYELLCRRRAGGDASACRQLVASFRVG